ILRGKLFFVGILTIIISVAIFMHESFFSFPQNTMYSSKNDLKLSPSITTSKGISQLPNRSQSL
ncbi:MAG: hypothetical protein ACFFCQ_12575, partial [Promethearchaeota archaeon]